MKKKLKIIISIIVLVSIVAVILLIAFWPNNKEKHYTKKKIVELISKGFVNGISKEDLENLMNQDIADETMMTGEDAYLLQTPSEELINKYNLDSYVVENKKYFDNLEKKIKENYLWEFDGETEENQQTYFINLKTYSYGIYLSDLKEIVNQLMVRISNGDPKNINEYKAKIIAMKVLNSYLDEYIYNGDIKSIVIDFQNINSDETKNSLMQYLIDLAGYTNLQDENINAMEQNRQTRITEYIDIALNNGILDKNDILKI